MPIGWELAAADIGERVVAAEMLDRVPVAGHTVIADKNFAGAEFEALMAAHGASFLRPDRNNEPRRNGSLGAVRQWIESTFWTAKVNRPGSARSSPRPTRTSSPYGRCAQPRDAEVLHVRRVVDDVDLGARLEARTAARR